MKIRTDWLSFRITIHNSTRRDGGTDVWLYVQRGHACCTARLRALDARGTLISENDTPFLMLMEFAAKEIESFERRLLN